jgi:hypothetical protein
MPKKTEQGEPESAATTMSREKPSGLAITLPRDIKKPSTKDNRKIQKTPIHRPHATLFSPKKEFPVARLYAFL